MSMRIIPIVPIAASLLLTVSLAAQTSTPAPAAAQAAKPAASPNTWTIDGSHSSANFSVRHMMVSNVHGTFGKLEGTIEWDGKDVSGIKADATIDATTITTQNEKRDGHLKSADFFDVATYPTITFKSKRAVPAGAGKFKLIGDFTMRGITKEVTLDVEGPSQALTSQGRTRVGATATTTLNRQDYKVSWNRTVDGGGYVVGDDIKVTLELELIKAAPATSSQN